MAVLFNHMWSGYHALIEDSADPRVRHLPLMSSPFPTFFLVLMYYYFINNYGPKLMKDRPPLNVYYPMVIYNWIQIAANGWFTYKALSLIWLPNKYSWVCEPVDYSNNPLAVEVAWYSWLYFMVKVLDLFDTVFMVLRKKDNQITFLHTYHHIGMTFAGWIGTKYVAGGHSIFFGTVNCIVHIIMYSYYQVTLVYPEYKKDVWWKKHITEVQLIQFVVTTLHACAGLLSSNCRYPKYLLGIWIPQDVFMFFLFLDFYRKSYWPKKTKVEELKS